MPIKTTLESSDIIDLYDLVGKTVPGTDNSLAEKVTSYIAISPRNIELKAVTSTPDVSGKTEKQIEVNIDESLDNPESKYHVTSLTPSLKSRDPQ